MPIYLKNVEVVCDHCGRRENAVVRLPGSTTVLLGAFATVEHPLGWISGVRTIFCGEDCAKRFVEIQQAEAQSRMMAALLTEDEKM